MLPNYLKIAWRNLLKDRQFSFLNISGLAAGLGCALLIYLWANDELHIDKFHDKSNLLYQIKERQQQDNKIYIKDQTAGLTAETLSGEMPEIEYAVPVMHYSSFPKFVIYHTDDNKIKGVGQFVGKDYFNVFSYELIQGNKNQVLTDKSSIVISEVLALKLFKTTKDIIGKPLEWQLGSFKEHVTVSGIFKSVPANSSEQFDFVLSFEKWKELIPDVLDWGNDGTNAYLLLKKGTNVQQFNDKIAGFIKKRVTGSNRSLFLKLYSDNYLYGRYENGVQAGGRIEYVRLFSIIAIFILLIACVNFMNLSTAKAARRIKEVGIKKVVGASRRSLIIQYLGESMLITFLAMIITIVVVFLLLPQFNVITGKHLVLRFDTNLILVIFSVTFITGLISGSYPALYISGFNPVTVLKGKLKTSAGELWVRKGLMVFQFALSVIFIVSVLVVYRQIALIQTKSLGYNKDNIVYFEKEGRLNEKQNAFLSEVKKIPGIINASSIDRRLAGSDNTTGGVDWQGKRPNQSVDFEIVRVNYDMIEMLGIAMKEGRSFSKSFPSDTSKIIFNEAAIDVMGFKAPVVGKIIKLYGKPVEIVGVARNFHYESLHENVKPLFIMFQPKSSNYIMTRIAAGKEKEAIDGLQEIYKTFNPGYPFEYKFLDEDYQALYSSEQRVAILSRYFAGLAIIISCLGLFGLAAFTAQRRQKEIGIRKVMGASAGNVVLMLSKDFLKLILVAVIIAFPVAWWAMNQWLHGFAYRINLDIDVFLIAGISTVLITLLAISFQSIKAAIANPVKSLRME